MWQTHLGMRGRLRERNPYAVFAGEDVAGLAESEYVRPPFEKQAHIGETHR